jgi:putative flippase GtrA
MAKQAIRYFTFAILMILLNELIQFLHITYFVPFVQDHFGDISIVQDWYLASLQRELFIGSGIAVVITVVVKFILDKFFTFEKKSVDVKEMSREFTIYFGFAILTTIENLAIQTVLDLINVSLIYVWIIIALSIGYITKFFLDRKYCFHCV